MNEMEKMVWSAAFAHAIYPHASDPLRAEVAVRAADAALASFRTVRHKSSESTIRDGVVVR